MFLCKILISVVLINGQNVLLEKDVIGKLLWANSYQFWVLDFSEDIKNLRVNHPKSYENYQVETKDCAPYVK